LALELFRPTLQNLSPERRLQHVGQNWRLFGISLQTQEVALQANIPATPQR